MEFYLFPKNFQHLSLEQMMQKTAELGFDGPTALIRDGFWLTEDNLKTDIPKYISLANKLGMNVKYADSDLTLDGIAEDKSKFDLLYILAQNGIENVRMAHIPKNPSTDPRSYADSFRKKCEKASVAAEKVGIRVVVQIHGYCYPHNATSTYFGLKDLNPRFIGTKIDPGNNFAQEGFETYDYQVNLLKEYIAALGAKDCGYKLSSGISNDNKGWYREFLPAYEGFINYKDVFSNLKNIGFDGPVVLMPFYGAENDDLFFEKVKHELEYFKQVSDCFER